MTGVFFLKTNERKEKRVRKPTISEKKRTMDSNMRSMENPPMNFLCV
jgi:hypothetical protein